MPKAVSSPSPRTAAKKASAATSGQTRKSVEPPAPPPDSTPDALSILTQRLEGLEEKLAASLSSVVAEIRALPPPPTDTQPQEPAPDTTLPLIADLIRRSLTEHLTPITAALKRVEERIGFIGNRLKYPGGGGGGGPERQKPWRHDQPRHDQGRHSRPRPHNGPQGPRPGQGPQPWSPPSAASVQGHFAPRQRFGGDDQRSHEDEE